jgi:PAS domain S-box-containing protein
MRITPADPAWAFVVEAGKRRRYALAPLAVMLVLVLLAAGVWWRDRTLAEEALQSDFNHRRTAIESEVVARLGRAQDLLWAIRVGLSGGAPMSAERWGRLDDMVRASGRLAGINSYGLVSYVRAADLPEFVARCQQESAAFRVFPASDRADYMIITFASPDRPGVVGFDEASDPERRSALEQSRDSGRAVFIRKIRSPTKGGMLGYLPIYWPDRAPQERGATLVGWAMIEFSLEEILEGLVASADSTAVQIFDGTATPDSLMLTMPGRRFAGDRTFKSQSAVDIAGRRFVVAVASAVDASRFTAGTALVLGVLGLAGLFLLILMQQIIRALGQREECLRVVLESGHDGFWDWDVRSETAVFSPQFATMLGYHPSELRPVRQTWEDLVHPDDKPAIRRRFIDYFRGRSSVVDHEYRLRNHAGDWRWVRETAAIVRRKGERTIRVAGAVADVTERRKAEDRVRLLSTVVEESPASVVITDEAGVIFYVNRVFESVTGFSSSEALGRKPSIVASGMTPLSTYQEMWAALTAGGRWRGELCNRKKDGSLHWEDVCITQVRNREGAICYVGVKLDITDKKQADTMLLHSHKMEAIGTLAGGIAHDFNNILTSILGFNRLILGDIDDPGAVAGHVRQIDLAGGRARDLVRQILTFSRQMPSQKLAIDLCQIANEVYQLIRTAAPVNIKVTLALLPGRAMVLGTAIQLHQVLMNLCLNAIDAIGDKTGTISIALDHRDGSFHLSVTDSGCGIAPDVQPRIFDPFFTTKKAGAGTGLGLSVVYGIVEELGGTISVDAPSAGGCRFVVMLAEIKAAAEAHPVAKVLPAVPDAIQAQDMLIVDDDPGIVDLLDRFFVRKGHRVLSTTEAADALDRIRRGERFDIIITDQMMPEVSGTDLARAAAEHLPGSRVLLCSGRDDAVDYEEIVAAGVDGFVLKPFDLDELADTVECLLGGTSAVD